MANNITAPALEYEEVDDDFETDDYGFIVSADGELKSVLFPENLMGDPPIEVQMILKIYGITNFNELENKTLH